MRHWLRFMALVVTLLAVTGVAQEIVVTESWSVNANKPSPKSIQITRGESRHIQPTVLDNSAPWVFPTNATVVMHYRSAGMTNSYYSMTGSVYSATGGILRLVWTPEREADALAYTFEIEAATGTASQITLTGAIFLKNSLTSYSVPSNPATYHPWTDTTDGMNASIASNAAQIGVIGIVASNTQASANSNTSWRLNEGAAVMAGVASNVSTLSVYDARITSNALQVGSVGITASNAQASADSNTATLVIYDHRITSNAAQLGVVGNVASNAQQLGTYASNFVFTTAQALTNHMGNTTTAHGGLIASGYAAATNALTQIAAHIIESWTTVHGGWIQTAYDNATNAITQLAAAPWTGMGYYIGDGSAFEPVNTLSTWILTAPNISTFNNDSGYIPTNAPSVGLFGATVGVSSFGLGPSVSIGNYSLAFSHGGGAINLSSAGQVAFDLEGTGIAEHGTGAFIINAGSGGGLYLDSACPLYMASGSITLTAGGITLTAGDLTLTAGDIALASGDITLTSGSMTLTAGQYNGSGAGLTAIPAGQLSGTIPNTVAYVLPTSAAGLPSGALWNDNGTPSIVP